MGSKKAPAAPDYTGAAERQAQSSERVTNQQTWANRPTINTPWGQQSWNTQAVTDPATGQQVTEWTQNLTLSPEQQAALDSQMAIQQGRSEGAQTLLGQAVGNFQRPMDWNSLPQRAGQMEAPQLSNTQIDPRVANTQGPASSMFSFGGGGNARAPVRRIQGMGALQTSAGDPSMPNREGPAQSALTSSVQQRGVADPVQGGQIQGQLSQTPNDWRQTAQNAVWDLQRPMLDEQQASLETQLANQGLARGGEAWNREMRRMDDARARAQLQAVAEGRNEAGQLFNQDLASGQFANAAQSQQFGQGMQNAAMFNAGQNQLFGQDMQNAALMNAAQGQQFSQGLQGLNFENQAAQQEFNNRTGNAGLNNAAMQQYFNAGMSQGQFANQAQQQQFNNQLANNQFFNQAGQQQFAQNMAQQQFQNQAGQQQFENMVRMAQMGDQRAQQQLAMQMQAGAFNNQNRQQAIAEEQMRRGQTLNELNALLTGQQVGMPSMPSFNTAGRSDTTNYMGAAQNQYQASMDAFNARQAGQAGMMGGLFQLGSAAMGAGGWGGLFSMGGSDPSYKYDIVHIGTHSKLGIGIYAWTYLPEYAEKWGHGRIVGVMADELVEVLPEAVSKDADGHTVVDYSKVWA